MTLFIVNPWVHKPANAKPVVGVVLAVEKLRREASAPCRGAAVVVVAPKLTLGFVVEAWLPSPNDNPVAVVAGVPSGNPVPIQRNNTSYYSHLNKVNLKKLSDDKKFRNNLYIHRLHDFIYTAINWIHYHNPGIWHYIQNICYWMQINMHLFKGKCFLNGLMIGL